MAKKDKSSSGGNMLSGMTRKCPAGDSGMRPVGGSMADGATRDSVAHGHTIGGRNA
jgi:hypothetical protein